MRTGRPKGKVGTRPTKMPAELKAWKNMRARCYTSSSTEWHRYGGRGIEVCPQWRDSYETFLRDVGPRPSPHHTLDRHPNADGNYEPGNVRWATYQEQGRNTSLNRTVTFQGKDMLLCEAVELSGHGLPYNTILYRLKRGWSVEDAITRPRQRGIKP